MSPHAELVSRLRAAWLSGKTRPMEYRLAQLEALGRFLDEKKQDILEATAADMRKPPFEVEVSELSICRSELNHTLNNLGAWMKDKHVEKNWATQLDSAFIRKDPYGVVLIIGPWNYPINLLLVPLIGAIAAGNCVVMKPSEITRNVERLVAETLPRYLDESPDFGRIVGDRQFQRVQALLHSGHTAIGGQTDAGERYIAPTVLVEVQQDDPVMQEEIFGPILPILTVTSVDDAIAFINARERPLVLYVFSSRKEVVKRVLERTSSGGFCANDTIMHMTIPSLPFGGIGQSGLGRYHGRSSFETFSHQRSALLRGAGRETLNTPPGPDMATLRLLYRAARTGEGCAGLPLTPFSLTQNPPLTLLSPLPTGPPAPLGYLRPLSTTGPRDSYSE
uniref:Aldehyde dehydrogenase domain-containing protein n=1 Tax=Buteo japonicus TaxID=224669 RepID=A0A8B9YXK5_9AVES